MELPSELWLLIMEFGGDDLASVICWSAVCRIWYAAMQREVLWKTLYMRFLGLPASTAYHDSDNNKLGWRERFIRDYKKPVWTQALAHEAYILNATNATMWQPGSLYFRTALCAQPIALRSVRFEFDVKGDLYVGLICAPSAQQVHEKVRGPQISLYATLCWVDRASYSVLHTNWQLGCSPVKSVVTHYEEPAASSAAMFDNGRTGRFHREDAVKKTTLNNIPDFKQHRSAPLRVICEVDRSKGQISWSSSASNRETFTMDALLSDSPMYLLCSGPAEVNVTLVRMQVWHK